MTRALHYLGEQNLENLGPILEAEALEMHAVMLTQKNPLHYLQQETMQTIAWLRNARQRTGLKAYFTIDAGPNLHVISDRHNQIALLQLLKNERPSGVKQVIEDKVGTGADFCSLDDWLIKKQKDPEK
jgi:diphosphomevalonate decarboxylase